MLAKPANGRKTLTDKIAQHPVAFAVGVALAGLGIGLLASLEITALRMAHTVDMINAAAPLKDLHYPTISEIASSLLKRDYDERDYVPVGKSCISSSSCMYTALDARYYFNQGLQYLPWIGVIFGGGAGGLQAWAAWANAKEEKISNSEKSNLS